MNDLSIKRLPRPFSRYSIDRSGQVYSHIGKGSVKPKPLQARKDREGYLRVNLSYDEGSEERNKSQNTLLGIHRLMIIAFGKDSERGNVVRHLNGCRDDNRLENLAWGTAQDNAEDAARHTLLKRGSSSTLEQNIAACVFLRVAGFGPNDISRMLDISASNVLVYSTEKNFKILKIKIIEEMLRELKMGTSSGFDIHENSG
jgi:hypothetical protein